MKEDPKSFYMERNFENIDMKKEVLKYVSK